MNKKLPITPTKTSLHQANNNDIIVTRDDRSILSANLAIFSINTGPICQKY